MRLFTLSSSPQFAEASAAPQSLIRRLAFHWLDPCSEKGQNFSHQLKKFCFDLCAIWAILKGAQPGSRSPLLCSKLAGDFIKVAGQALEQQISRPSRFFSANQLEKSFLRPLSLTLKELSKSASVCRGHFFLFCYFFFSGKTSVTKLESQLK